MTLGIPDRTDEVPKRPRATAGLSAQEQKQAAELLKKTAQGVWDAIPGTGAILPTGIVFGVEDAVDPNLSVEDRIKGGASTCEERFVVVENRAASLPTAPAFKSHVEGLLEVVGAVSGPFLPQAMACSG